MDWDYHLFYNGGQSKVLDIEHIVAPTKLITEVAVNALNPDHQFFLFNRIEKIWKKFSKQKKN